MSIPQGASIFLSTAHQIGVLVYIFIYFLQFRASVGISPLSLHRHHPPLFLSSIYLPALSHPAVLSQRDSRSEHEVRWEAEVEKTGGFFTSVIKEKVVKGKNDGQKALAKTERFKQSRDRRVWWVELVREGRGGGGQGQSISTISTIIPSVPAWAEAGFPNQFHFHSWCYSGRADWLPVGSLSSCPHFGMGQSRGEAGGGGSFGDTGTWVLVDILPILQSFMKSFGTALSHHKCQSLSSWSVRDLNNGL